MTGFEFLVIAVGVALVAWLAYRMNKNNGSAAADMAVVHHGGVGHVGLDPVPNNVDEAINAHSGVGYTGVPASTELASEAPAATTAVESTSADAVKVIEKAAKKAPAKKAPAKKAASKPAKKTTKG